MKKHVVVCLDDLGKLLPFFFVVRFGHKRRETYNGIERCPYVMAHIGEESAFEAVGFFGFFTQANQFLGMFQIGDIMFQTDNTAYPPVFITLISDGLHLEPLVVFHSRLLAPYLNDH